VNDGINDFPQSYTKIREATIALGFDQLSDEKVGSLLSTLCASKANGVFLELGTGTGLCTSWMLHGMCKLSRLITVDNEKSLVDVAKKYLGEDPRVEFILGKGEELIEGLTPASVDLIFADTWPGKYNHLEETLSLLKEGGIYVIDDMLPQENWPQGHAEKADNLINYLESRDDLLTSKLSWSTGVMICSKKA
jgi:predicted O-methyltransferase YrrM